MPAGHSEVLWRNTIGFLDPANLRRIKDLGGRAKRGLLLSGPPGNGKTTACRWIFRECRRLVAETCDSAERFHRLCDRASAVGFGLEAILLQKAEISLRDAQWRTQIVDEQVHRLNLLIGMRYWHTS